MASLLDSDEEVKEVDYGKHVNVNAAQQYKASMQANTFNYQGTTSHATGLTAIAIWLGGTVLAKRYEWRGVL